MSTKALFQGHNGIIEIPENKAMFSCSLIVSPDHHFFFQIGTNIPTYLECCNSQPHILAMGERQSPEQVFVIIEGTAIPCTSLLKAVDTCFKLCYVLDVDYSWQCHHGWVFLQKHVYGLGGDNGTSAPSVMLLSNFLQTERK